MAAPKGNHFWEARTSHGRKPKYAKTPEGAEALWSDCCEYFQWVNDNPLVTYELVKFQGEATLAELPVKRAMLLDSLCDYIGLDPSAWHKWKKDRKDLFHVITRAERVIYRQKFEGAAAGQLNPNIIARDLGLSDKTDHTSSDGSMTPQQVIYRLPDNGRDAS